MLEFYQTHLQSQLQQGNYLLLSCLVQLLQSVKQVRLETIATHLPLPVTFESRRRKLQRFLKLPQLSFEQLWFPILIHWLQSRWSPQSLLHLAIDRTSWSKINLLVISLIWQKRAIPIYMIRLNKLGSSNLAEQQQVLTPALQLLKSYKIVILGDREFCSVKLADWLRRNATDEGGKIYFCLRLKRNEYVELVDNFWLELGQMGLTPGHHLYLNGVSVTKQKGFGKFNLAAKWQGRYRGWETLEEWFILTNLSSLEAAMSSYQRRFSIEELFRDWKSGGYDLEKTQLSGTRLLGLLVLLTIAYSHTSLQGRVIKEMGLQKYIGRTTEARRTTKRHSNFYIGRYAQIWVGERAQYESMISELMEMNRNKWKFYRQGLRAMTLILSAS
jgi:Transposase DDE domain